MLAQSFLRTNESFRNASLDGKQMARPAFVLAVVHTTANTLRRRLLNEYKKMDMCVYMMDLDLYADRNHIKTMLCGTIIGAAFTWVVRFTRAHRDVLIRFFCGFIFWLEAPTNCFSVCFLFGFFREETSYYDVPCALTRECDNLFGLFLPFPIFYILFFLAGPCWSFSWFLASLLARSPSGMYPSTEVRYNNNNNRDVSIRITHKSGEYQRIRVAFYNTC